MEPFQYLMDESEEGEKVEATEDEDATNDETEGDAIDE